MTQTLPPPATWLTGRALLVTGGSGGIGQAVCAHLRAAGAELLHLDRPGAPPVEGASNLSCDVGDATAIAALAPQLPGQLFGFVHCAGIARDAVLWKMPPADWNAVLRVNLDSAFHLLQFVVPRLRACGEGSVVLISSINGERGKFGQANYAASKAGLIGLGRTARQSLKNPNTLW